jgi:gluconate 5-dehydrogenase
MKNYMDLAGRVVIVTGASSGLGHDYCKAFAEHSITVNAVAPGMFPSEMMNVDEGTLQYLKMRCPIGRPGRISELCGQVLLFASEGNSYNTGQTICIDGGWTSV